MTKYMKFYCGCLALLGTCMGSAQSFAAEAAMPVREETASADQSAAEETQQLPPAPVTIEGDDLSVDNVTGEVYAKGNVVITHKEARLEAEDIRGNTKTADVWIDDRAHITEPPLLSLDGYNTAYNYQTREGTMERFKGVADGKHVSGAKTEFYPDEVIIYNGTITKCPAKKPDYHISADKIEIWPDNKMVAHNAKVWIRGKQIYSMSRYETKIGKNGKKDTAFPRFGYNKNDGAFITQHLERPLTKEIAAFVDLGYYSKIDFKADYGLVWRRPDYALYAEAGDFRDDDDNWIKKQPNLRFELGEKRIGNTPYNYRFEANYGKWSDSSKTSWHQEYEIYVRHDPIMLDPTLKLNVGGGYQIIKESYDGSRANSLTQDISLHKEFTPRFSAWTGYHYTKNSKQRSLFHYKSADISKELANGLSYQLDDKNTLIVEQSYDLERGRTEDIDYTWRRDLHCWEMELTYREKRKEIKVDFTVKSW